MSVASVLGAAFVLGIAYCAPPGAVTAEATRRGLSQGFWGAFWVELGSLVGDGCWAALALAGAAALAEHPATQAVLGLLGSGLLLRLAWSAWRETQQPAFALAAGPGSGRGALATGAVLSLTNPWAIVFWLGVGGALGGVEAETLGRWAYALFLGGFLTAALVWCVVLAGLAAWGRRALRPSVFRWISGLCALALLGLGLRAGWLALTALGALLG